MKTYLTTKDYHLKEQEILPCLTQKSDIVIDSHNTLETHQGFGAAYTQSAAVIYQSMSKSKKKQFVSLIKDLNYIWARVTIGSCDFSVDDYDYLTENDISTFSLKHEEKDLFPMLSDIKKVIPLQFMAACWSPPKYMKTNDDRSHGGYLKEEYYEDLAIYFTKYLEAMDKEGFPITYLSVQNEPEAVQVWESCIYSAEQEAKLVNLVNKECKARNINVSLLTWDHNQDHLLERAKNLSKYLASDIYAGYAYHWYGSVFDNTLSLVHSLDPSKILFFTEGCIEGYNKDKETSESKYAHAMRYAKNYICDSMNYASGFIDWNILLDDRGGPNHVGNYCESPLMYNKETETLIINPSYYAIYHFSHFIKPKAKRIQIDNTKDFLVVAYKNVDNTIATIILNTEKEARNFIVDIDGNKYEILLPSESIFTMVSERN